MNLLLLGDAAEDAQQALQSETIHTETAAGEAVVSTAKLEEFIGRTSAEFLVVASADPPPAATELQRALDCLNKEPDALAALVALPGTDPLLQDCWRRLPASIACFIRQPERFAAVVFRRESLPVLENLAVHSAPLWDLVIRAAQLPQPFPFVDHPLAAGEVERHEEDDLPPLTPVAPETDRLWLRDFLQQSALFPPNVAPASPPDLVALRAGLLQIHDFLDESHQQSQSIEGAGRHAAGDYWHAIMHRREPNYSNSKYWFRRVGQHPIFAPLAKVVSERLRLDEHEEAPQWAKRLGVPDRWDPLAFVDFCEYVHETRDTGLNRLACEIQRSEMLLLLMSTYEDACGT